MAEFMSCLNSVATKCTTTVGVNLTLFVATTEIGGGIQSVEILLAGWPNRAICYVWQC